MNLDEAFSNPTTATAEEAFRMFTQDGLLVKGDWFYAPRGWPLPTETSHRVDEWEWPIDGPRSHWKPVGGPPVGARLVVAPHWCELIFDQERHPFTRFDVEDISIGYQAVGTGLFRVYAPNPRQLDRVRLTLTPSLSETAISAYVPGVLNP